MARLGPFGAAPRLAVAVSGGADSTALALLAQNWAEQNNGSILALIVDHGLREASAAEAELAAARLAVRGIKSKISILSGISAPAIQEKARAARYAALGNAALADGRLHLLLGHHAGDQAETVAMRARRGPGGAEGVAAWTARDKVLLLRPLLEVPPAALRAYLAAENMEWVEDPSNQNQKFERARIRLEGTGAQPAGADARQARELEAAQFLARHAVLRPEGFAVLDAPAAPVAALAALLRVIGGNVYAPDQQATAALAARLRPATLGGVRILAAGRLGPGWLLVREQACLAPPIPARCGALWDGRFTVEATAAPGMSLGALGDATRKYRKYNGLPEVVLCAMPALHGPDGAVSFPAPARFTPPAPVAPHPFFSSRQ
jgi:tRNA(Ile)-lysidine synthase